MGEDECQLHSLASLTKDMYIKKTTKKINLFNKAMYFCTESISDIQVLNGKKESTMLI